MTYFQKKQAPKEDSFAVQEQQNNPKLSDDLLVNIDSLKTAFSYPANNALKFRNLYLPLYKKSVAILFIEGTVNIDLIDMNILKPMTNNPESPLPKVDFVSLLTTTILTSATTEIISTVKDATNALVNGNTIILIDQEQHALSVDTAKFENRAVSEPTTETDIVGPKVAFNESAAVNRSLLRRQLRNPDFICETVTVGDKSSQEVFIMYLNNIADEKLVDNIKKRLQNIETDAVLTLSQVGQYIEERPYSLIPSTLQTERPDRAASFVLEGHIVLVMENSPSALVAPTTFWSFFHTVEDQYLRMPYGNFLRIIRLIAIFIALLVPALYIALTTFHSEMLPTDLMLAIAATRERIPFPVFIEILIMEVSFEILREAGVRVPNVLGPTIGIVGALILGQAAVQANIVSPILVVVVAITGLASFTIPDVSLNIAVRMFRFIFLIVAYLFGFFGMAIVAAFSVAYLVSLKSFGVPFFAPFAPYLPSSNDMVTRKTLWQQWLRPFSTSPKQKVRAAKPKGDAKK